MDEDRQPINSILAGDPQAWEKSGRRFADMVWRILRGRFRVAKDEAADAFQEIFLNSGDTILISARCPAANLSVLPT